MKGIVKHIMCMTLVLSIVSIVLFAPYIYYSASDNKSSYQIDSFELTNKDDNYKLTISDISKLASSNYSIWVNNNESISRDNITSIVLNSVNSMAEYISTSKYEKSVIEYIMKNNTIYRYNTGILTGTVDDRFISASFLYVVFDEKEKGVYFQIIIERNTNKILYLQIIRDEGLFNMDDALSECYDSNDEIIYRYFYDTILEDLCKYLETSSIDEKNLELYCTSYEFTFSFIPEVYYYMFNSQGKFMTEDDYYIES